MAERREYFYNKHGKALEKSNKGDYLAIGFNGQTILGKDEGEVLKNALIDFGAGEFVFTRIGYPTLGSWLVVERK